MAESHELTLEELRTRIQAAGLSIPENRLGMVRKLLSDALVPVRALDSRAVKTVVVWGVVTGALFAANAAITGEFNYQGGDRKTFYHTTGFPFCTAYAGDAVCAFILFVQSALISDCMFVQSLTSYMM